MFCQFQGARRVEDAVIATRSQLGAGEIYFDRRTFVSTNLFIVARIS